MWETSLTDPAETPPAFRKKPCSCATLQAQPWQQACSLDTTFKRVQQRKNIKCQKVFNKWRISGKNYSRVLQSTPEMWCNEERLLYPSWWITWIEDGKVTAEGVKATAKRKADKKKENMKGKSSECWLVEALLCLKVPCSSNAKHFFFVMHALVSTLDDVMFCPVS